MPPRTPHRRLLPPPIGHGEAAFLADRLRSEVVGGALALLAAAIALVWANTAGGGYESLRHLGVGPLDLEHWASDGGLALFFFVAGLELKRELTTGSLRRPADAAVPVVAAVCGVALPAGIYLLVNRGSGNAEGWAIGSATDVAFALAVLAVVGSALPTALRAFLLTLAVVDDLIVIAIIAVFYSGRLQPGYLVASAVLCGIFAAAQRQRVRATWLYLPLALATWWCVYSSGVHATVAGVMLGLLTRAAPDPGEDTPPAVRLEHRLGPLSANLAVPLFALLSAGVPITGEAGVLASPVFYGVLLGLVLGKPAGVLGGTWLVTRFTRAELGGGLGWRDLAGLALATGIGFTVSLLVSDLSFTDVRRAEAKTGVLLASVASGAIAAVVLRRRDRLHRAT